MKRPGSTIPWPTRVGRRALGSVAALSVVAAISFAAPSATASTGNFHTSCGFVKSARVDPIVFPRKPGKSHLHYFFGNKSTNTYSTYRSMVRAGTLCGFKADTAGYWTPALLNRSGNVVHPRRLTVYYWAGDGGTVTAPPANLKMIAGGNTRRLRIVGYACGEGHPTSSVPVNCGSGWLRGVVVFPSCWDGKRLDSWNHRAHIAYPAGSGCPADHRVRVPKIVFHINYGIHDGRGYHLVSDHEMGMRHGMSLHADFWNTWHQKALVTQVDRCLNGGLTCEL